MSSQKKTTTNKIPSFFVVETIFLFAQKSINLSAPTLSLSFFSPLCYALLCLSPFVCVKISTRPIDHCTGRKQKAKTTNKKRTKMASSNEAVPPPHASLRRRRHSRSLASLLCPQPPGFLRLDSLARYAVAAVKGLAAAVEAATAVAVSAAAASAWYAGEFFFFSYFLSLSLLSDHHN